MHTIFQNFTTIIENKPFPDILTDIKSGKYMRPVSYIRKCLEEQKTDAYDKAKKALIAFTPSGEFEGGRNQNTLKNYSGLMVLDFDKLSPPQLQNCIQTVIRDAYTHAAFISPSGNGLKVFVQTTATPNSHKSVFLQLQAHFEELTQLPIDKSGKDFTRLCFMSFDPETYHNPDSKAFNPESTSSHRSPVTGHQSPLTSNQPPATSQQPTANSQPLTAPLTLYHSIVKYTNNIETYTAGNHNNYVYQLACNLNRAGLPYAAALGFILTDYNFNEKEVMTTVQSAYKNSTEHSQNNPLKNAEDEEEEIKKRLPVIDKVENFLLTKYRYRYNTITHRLEYRFINKKRWHQMNDYTENSMLRELLKNKIRTNISGLRNLLYSDFCELFNPFTTYFDNLPAWDENTDFIAQLADTITTTRQELWHICFKKWLVAMVGSVLDEKTINQTVIVFSGKQGIGKTTWMENLVPKELKNYLFSGTINPNNKDTLLHLSECMLINLDELENLNRTEIGSLKELITKTHIRIRRAYGHNNETLSRCASFAGSVNTAQFLNDTTGSRRFLSFEVTDIKYNHKVLLNDVYSQAVHLYKTGFRFWFNREEIETINQNNEQYQLRTPEEELLLTWFEACTKEEANVFLNASQIAAKLADKAKFNITDATVNKIGKALVKNNYFRFKSSGKTRYALRELQWEEVDYRNRSMSEESSSDITNIKTNIDSHNADNQELLPF